jgi:hypothetical protein
MCRTAKDTQLGTEGERFAFDRVGVQPRERMGLPAVTSTLQEYGPVLAIAWWDKDYQEPIYPVTNLELADEACYWYAKRFRIETFFSDQKSRGFNLHKSHLAAPDRLARMLIATCLAYVRIIYLRVIAKQNEWVKIIHRPDRYGLSLSQLGLILLDHLLNEPLSIPVAFHMPWLATSVR